MIGLATGALVAAVWQGILLAAVVGIGLRMLPKAPAAVRFAIWFGAFVVVTALPLVSLWPHGSGVVRASGPWLTVGSRWGLGIAAVWVAASVVRAVQLVVAAVRVRGLWKRATPIVTAGPGLKPLTLQGALPQAKACCYSEKTSRKAELCVSDEVDRPTVIGFFAPKILLPGWLLEKLTAAELEQVVLHEAGHLRRADDWLNLLQKIALVLFPLNPALAWVERRLCFERELAVDEGVLRVFAGKAGAATEYARCLATVAEHRLGRRKLALALGALGRESELGRRVGRILRRGETMRPAHARLVLGGALLGLVGFSAGLERCPQVIGFAAEQPVMAQADVVNSDRVHGFIGNRVNVVQGGSDAPHEVLLNAVAGGLGAIAQGEKRGPQRLQPRSPAADYGTAQAVSLTQVSAVKPAHAGLRHPEYREIASTSPAQSGQARAVTRWVVVASWQEADGSRMVLTTATTENPAVRASRMQSDVAPQPRQDSEQVPQYAAVPVRGGWLVIQL